MDWTRFRKRIVKTPTAAWQFATGKFLSPWRITVGGQTIEILERSDWLEKLHRGEIVWVDNRGLYEGSFVDMFVSRLDSSSVLLDVGAARGYYAVIASHFCSPENIYAFEPTRYARYVLSQNNQKYCQGKLNIIPKFVDGVTNANSVSLDDFCTERGIRPTLVKMDIEGAEVNAILGMQRICREYHPTLLIEFHVEKLKTFWKKDPDQVVEMIRSYGYKVKFNGHHGYIREHPGQADPDWHDALPNDWVCALLAEAQV